MSPRPNSGNRSCARVAAPCGVRRIRLSPCACKPKWAAIIAVLTSARVISGLGGDASRSRLSGHCRVNRGTANRTAETTRISSSSTSGGKFSLKANSATRARNSVEFKGKFCQPDREFESCLVRHLVHCFSREIYLSEIIAEGRRLASPKSVQATTESEIWRMVAPCRS